MPTRRRTLALAGGLLASLTGCLDRSEGGTGAGPRAPMAGQSTGTPASTPGPAGTPTVAGTERPSPTGGPKTRTDPPDAPGDVTTVPDDLPAWETDRQVETDYANVLGLDAGEGRIYAVLNDEGGGSAVAALDPGAASFDWTATAEGDPTSGSQFEPTDSTDTWGVTVADGAVYSVHGLGETDEWTALDALDAASGERRWSFRRERRLAVRGFVGDTVVVSGREFEPDLTHATPEEPLRTDVYGVDAASGDRRWSTAATDVSDVAVGPDGVYVAHGETVTAVGPDGSNRWDRQVGEPVREATVVDGVVVLAVGADVDESSLVGLSGGGERAWTAPVSTRYLVPHGDRVYAMDENVAAVTRGGTVAWRQRVHGSDPLLSTDGDRLYTRTAARMNAVDAFALPGGERQFRFETPSNNGWPLAETDETLVAEAITPEKAEFTSLFAVDADTGEPRAVYRPSETVFTAQGYEGTVYVGFGDGRIRVFER